MNAIELIEFNTTNMGAIEFQMAATDDYVACRCCLLNGLFPGLRLGAEAVEKLLKSFILFVNPKTDVRKEYKSWDHQIGCQSFRLETRL
jgi:hypothetical protein